MLVMVIKQHMFLLCLLGLGEQEALLRDTPTSQTMDSASTGPPLLVRVDLTDGRAITLADPPLGSPNAVPAGIW